MNSMNNSTKYHLLIRWIDQKVNHMLKFRAW